MAEHHDAKAVLKIARELVHRVQSLIENQWMVLECLRNDHQSLFPPWSSLASTTTTTSSSSSSSSSSHLEPRMAWGLNQLYVFCVLMLSPTNKQPNNCPDIPVCFLSMVFVCVCASLKCKLKNGIIVDKIVLILRTWYFLVPPYKWQPMRRVAIKLQIGHLLNGPLLICKK